MNTKNGLWQGFALFDSGHSARAAQASIQNHMYVPAGAGVLFSALCAAMFNVPLV
jgi:N-acetylneuraminic acid mutarotase